MPNLHLKNGTWDSPSKIYIRSGGQWKQVGNVHAKRNGTWSLLKTIAPDSPSWVDLATDQPTSYTNPVLKWNKPTTGGAVTGYRIIPRQHDAAGNLEYTWGTLYPGPDDTQYGPWTCSQDKRYSFEIVALGKNGTESAPVTYNLLTGHAAVAKTGYTPGWDVDNSWRFPEGTWTAYSHDGNGSPNNVVSNNDNEWVDPAAYSFTGAQARTYEPKNNPAGVDPFYAGLSGANGSHWPWIVLYPTSGRRLVRYVSLEYVATRGQYDWPAFLGYPAFSRQSRGSAQYDLVYARDASNGGWIQTGGNYLTYVNNQYSTGQAFEAGNASWQCIYPIDTAIGHPLIRVQSYSLDQFGYSLASLRTRGTIRRVQMIWDTWNDYKNPFTYYEPPQQNNSTW